MILTKKEFLQESKKKKKQFLRRNNGIGEGNFE